MVFEHSSSPPATTLQVARNDPFGYILAWMLGLLVAMPLLVWAFAWWDGSPPKEPWSEILGGVTLMVASGLALLRLRTGRLRQRLESAPRVTAEVLRYISSGQWVTVRLRYRWEERVLERNFLLPYGKNSTRLEARSRVTLAINPLNPRRALIVELYQRVDALCEG